MTANQIDMHLYDPFSSECHYSATIRKHRHCTHLTCPNATALEPFQTSGRSVDSPYRHLSAIRGKEKISQGMDCQCLCMVTAAPRGRRGDPARSYVVSERRY